MKNTLLLIGFLLISLTGFSQKESYNWLFGNKAYIKFHTGAPTNYGGSVMINQQCTVSMSGPLGNLLFYSNGKYVWNTGNAQMPNGSGLYGSSVFTQPAIAFAAPGQPGKYYLVTTGDQSQPGCYYTIIDMSLEGGLGDVDVNNKNVFIPGTERTRGVITATMHANNEDVWVIVRSLDADPNKVLAYKVDKNGFQPPVSTPAIKSHGTDVGFCISKISPTGKLYVYSAATWSEEEPRTFELYSFNNVNGTFTPHFVFLGIDKNEYRCNGLDFSADGNFLYTTLMAVEAGPPQVVKQAIKQFSCRTIPSTAESFERTSYFVHNEDIQNGYCSMQLAPDGKIYIAQDVDKKREYLSRIGKPYLSGSQACSFEKDTVKLASGQNSEFGLPLFMPSYLARFYWKGNCFGDTTRFTSRFLPVPSSISWDFDDPDSGPNNQSNLANPVHYFSKTGVFKVKATAYGASETDFEVYEREVRIVAFPNINIGPNKQVCPGETVTLSAGLVPGVELLWSNNSTLNSIEVPAGEHWLRGTNVYGCVSTDTVEITTYPTPVANGIPQIEATTCGDPNGSITGLSATGTDILSYFWKDNSGNTVSTTSNLNNVGPGTYTLWVNYGNSASPCSISLGSHSISDAGNQFINGTPVTTPAYCGYPTGTITVEPIPGFSGLLQYSIISGDWSNTSGIFSGLAQGPYTVKARVISNPACECTFSSPVLVGSEDAPIIDSVGNIIPAYDGNADGSAEIFAQGLGFTYTIPGFPSQTNPVFNNLPAGPYTCTVTDVNDCSSEINFVIPAMSSMSLSATAGFASSCLGGVATIPLQVNNFTKIVSFNIVLQYDPSIVLCQNNVTDINPLLASNLQVNINASLGTITLTWSNTSSVSIPSPATLLNLQFNTLQVGVANIEWNEDPLVSWFTPENGLTINQSFNPGQITISNSPAVNVTSTPVCSGNPATISAIVNPPGNYTYTWVMPNGNPAFGPQITIPNAFPGDAGIYSVSVSDVSGCNGNSATNLIIYPAPNVGFTDDTLWREFPDTISARPGFAQYEWNTGESTSSIIVESEGTYSVFITDQAGCTAQGSVVVQPMSKMPNLFQVPTAFSPDADGLNDVFRPICHYDLVKEFMMEIYTKRGERIYQSYDAHAYWDGTYKGRPVPNGAYIWHIVYRSHLGVYNRDRGVVTVIH